MHKSRKSIDLQQKAYCQNISDHISYKEAIRSQTAIKKAIINIPNDDQLYNMRLLANNVFEPLRLQFGKPIFVSSFFRCEQLNFIIGGAALSQHCAKKGSAIDIDADVFGYFSNKEYFEFIRDNLIFDQLIWEFGDDNNPDWIHVSFNGGKNQLNILKSYIYGNKIQYKTF